jgi:hypothetical protein
MVSAEHLFSAFSSSEELNISHVFLNAAGIGSSVAER